SGGSHFGYHSQWKSNVFTLSSVCYRWREIAISTPELWAILSVALEECAMRPTKLSLTRSGHHPLILHVDGGSPFYGDDEEEDKKTEAYIRVLTDHSACWRELDINEARWSMTMYMADHPVSNTLLLESVSCCKTQIYGLFSHELPDAPIVTTIDYHFVDEYYKDVEEMKEALPWQTLHHLTMAYDKKEIRAGILELLRAGMNLQLLVLNGSTTMQ
ncbi:hypothetical protein V5O48_019461, partial [Marasmius crinis-equi]